MNRAGPHSRWHGVATLGVWLAAGVASGAVWYAVLRIVAAGLRAVGVRMTGV
jgi:hypothetical protein